MSYTTPPTCGRCGLVFVLGEKVDDHDTGTVYHASTYTCLCRLKQELENRTGPEENVKKLNDWKNACESIQAAKESLQETVRNQSNKIFDLTRELELLKAADERAKRTWTNSGGFSYRRDPIGGSLQIKPPNTNWWRIGAMNHLAIEAYEELKSRGLW